MPESRHRRRRGRQVQRGQRSAAAADIARPRRRKWTVRRILYVTASAVIAILVIAGFAAADFLSVGRPAAAGGLGDSREYVEGVGERQAIMATRNHVQPEQSVAYNSTPPTSGDHWDRWANCGFYEEGLPDERIVHNLEHGNIVVSYNLPPEGVSQLKVFMDDFDMSSVWAVTRFYGEVPENTVALAAWGVLDTMQGVDEDRIEKFFRNYAGTLGPEFPNGAPCTAPGITGSR